MRKPSMSFWPGLGGVDHVVDVAALGGHVRVEPLLGVGVDQLGLLGVHGVVGLGDLTCG
jgi:hypothetical protein